MDDDFPISPVLPGYRPMEGELIPDRQIAFIGGAPKAGGTILQAVLSDADGAVPLLGEMQHLKHLLSAYEEVESSWEDDSKYFFTDASAARSEFQHLIGGHIADVAHLYRSERLAIKAPELTQFATTIDELFPASIRLAMIRDPKDVVALQWRATLRELEMGHQPSMLPAGSSPDSWVQPGGKKPTADAVRKLARGVAATYELFPRSGWALVIYENLVKDPGRALDQLRKLSGWSIRFDPRATWRNVAFDYLTGSQTFQAAWHSELWGQPLTAERIGFHLQLLDAGALGIIVEECADITSLWTSMLWTR
jgi:Sulfotransferase family